MILSKLSQCLNVCFPIEVTLDGIVIFFRLEHLKKAKSPIEVTPSGMTMLVSAVQLENVPRSISVSVEGKETLSRFSHPSKT